MAYSATENRLVMRFVGAAIRSMPDVSEERMKYWLDNPHKLKIVLAELAESHHQSGGLSALHFGRLIFSPQIADALLDGQPIKLNPSESIILLALCETEDIATTEYLLERGRQAGYEWSSNLTNPMTRLKTRIGKLNIVDPDALITTISNVGYRLNKELLQPSQ